MEESEFPKSDSAKKEEEILRFWHEENIFEKTLEKEAPMGEFIFWDGPPFGNGEPHYGHLIPGTIKDIIPRYKTMRGYRVPRKWGWDCHGLPVENLVEKELGLKSKKDIEQYGIDTFNEAARDSVLRYEALWKEIIPRSGRWIDMDHPYKTMDTSYTESVWWSFKELHEKRLVYEQFKSMHLCPRCETTLANFEVNQGYQDIKDIAVVAKFEVKEKPRTYFLAWTTTPWTLPGNVALAVGKDIRYVSVLEKESGDTYILAKKLVEKVFADKEHDIVSEHSAQELEGMEYLPLFPYFAEDATLEHREKGWKVYSADFVTTEEGTGVVHIAPAFGDDDLILAQEQGLPVIHHVSKDGRFIDAVTDFAGVQVKPKDDHQSTDIKVLAFLVPQGKIFAKEKYEHSYPHCWRCETPLLNYASNSWFLKVSDLREDLVKNNNNVSWTPDHMQQGRFGKWLEGARDWALSRSRYWGSVLPVWKNSATGEQVVIGSFKELKEKTQRSGNTYYMVRHGEADHNISGTIDSDPTTSTSSLTERGRQQIHELKESLVDKKIDYIFASPLKRTQQTASILKEILGLSDEQIIIDDRLRESGAGAHEGESWKAIHDSWETEEYEHKFYQGYSGGESGIEIKNRMSEFLYEIESTYKDSNIVIVSHGDTLWLLQCGAEGLADRACIDIMQNNGKPFIQTGEMRELSFVPLPHTKNYVFDVHRPYIDKLPLVSKEGDPLTLSGDVFDVWYESGSMQFAAQHYPFEGASQFETKHPADFIAEGLDQTRGWFYVLSVLSTALFGRHPFKHVVVNGLLLAEDGKKMSKRLSNYPPLAQIFNTYGADVLRLFLMSLPVVSGEDARMSEKSLQEMASKFFGRLRNIVSLYEMYRDSEHADDPLASPSVLDQWILARLFETRNNMTKYLEEYALDKGAREMINFVDDFSTWYIRRNRDRIKGGDGQAVALATTHYVLKTFAIIIAPYTPFIAEELWMSLRGNDDVASVHLSSWPNEQSYDQNVLNDMEVARDMVNEGLRLRDEVNVKVRQPLQSLTINKKLGDGYTELIADELNVKEIKIGDTIVLDGELTDALRYEGALREFVRSVQSLRKQSNLSPDDEIILYVDGNDAGKKLIHAEHEELRRVANVIEIQEKILTEEKPICAHSFEMKASLTA